MFTCKRGDIVKATADAIVIPANILPKVSRNGVDLQIYCAAGYDDVMRDRKKIGRIDIGQARITRVPEHTRLHAKYIIHVVSPQYYDGKHGEPEYLQSCYINALKIAREKKCKSVVFPLLSTGNFHFPLTEAVDIAYRVLAPSTNCDLDITLLIYDKNAKAIDYYNKYYGDLDGYLNNNCCDVERDRALVREFEQRNAQCEPFGEEDKAYLNHARNRLARRKADLDEFQQLKSEMDAALYSFMQPYSESEDRTISGDPGKTSETLTDHINRELDFKKNQCAALLNNAIQESGLSGKELACQADMAEGTLSALRNGHRAPQKYQILDLMYTLHRSVRETQKLCMLIDVAFPSESPRDYIIEYFMMHGLWSRDDLNSALRDHRAEELTGRKINRELEKDADWER